MTGRNSLHYYLQKMGYDKLFFFFLLMILHPHTPFSSKWKNLNIYSICKTGSQPYRKQSQKNVSRKRKQSVSIPFNLLMVWEGIVTMWMLKKKKKKKKSYTNFLKFQNLVALKQAKCRSLKHSSQLREAELQVRTSFFVLDFHWRVGQVTKINILHLNLVMISKFCWSTH